ncbi:TetR/AcrR family transcriptional regulator [Dietzia sp. DQ12-76]|nr:TetR/AcrR family transcriptional regulator [Dietzia sp. DQ12-76]MBB1026839.1 TetR/AcrR family transcriptional regulator [Dietzia sp. DQ11-38-2]
MTGEGIPAPRTRMTAAKRRQQLVDVGRRIFAEYGYDSATVEEIAAVAGVSKPVVYEHFGGKEGLYAVVCDRELAYLGAEITESLQGEGSRRRIERAAMALLRYVEERTDGFRILVRESSIAPGGSYSTLLNDATASVTYILEEEFVNRGFDPVTASVYAQALVGMVSGTAQWWLDVRTPPKEEVAAHIVNLCFNGLSHLDPRPSLEAEVRDKYAGPSSPEGTLAGRDLRPGPGRP